MKKIIVIVLIFLSGVILFTYPHLANYLSEKNGSYVIQGYRETVERTSEEDIDAAMQEAIQYNESLSGNPVKDPFVQGSGMVMQDNYYDVLKLHKSMGSVEIPKIKVNLPIYHGTSEAVLQRGVGHLEGSSLPIGGPGTHSVLTGHTGLVNARLFTDLTELKTGDLFYLKVLDQTAAYAVDQIQVVEPSNTENLKRVPGEDYCTLVTCTPYGINSHRLLVRGTRVEYVPEAGEDQTAQGLSWEQQIMAVAGIVSVVVLTVIAVVVRKSKKKKEEHKQ